MREIELARRLTAHFDVCCLRWTDALHVQHPSGLRRRWRQLRAALVAATVRARTSVAQDGVRFVEVPVLQPILLRRLMGDVRAFAWAQRFNRRGLERALHDLDIRYVLLANDAFGFPARSGTKIFYDFVDWFAEEQARPEARGWARDRVREVAHHAAAAFAVSEALRDKLRADFGVETVVLPNGADLQALRSVPAAEVARVRRRWGLEGKYVLGYIGNHGPAAGVDLVVRAFRALRSRMPDAVLFVVGPADGWRSVLDAARGHGVIPTGPVPPAEIAAYFAALDVGVLAKPPSAETDVAFHIKNVEYTACRKFVVATPLLTWRRLAWPNIVLTDLAPDAWTAAVIQARQSRWRDEWDRLVDPLDWRRLADTAAGVMLGHGA